MQFLFMLLIPITAFVCYTIIQKFIINKKPLEKGLVDETNVETKPLLCHDCKHCYKKVSCGMDVSRCLKVRKDTSRLDEVEFLVTGKYPKSNIDQTYYYCSTHRMNKLDDTMCQKEAKFFEAKFFEPKGEK